jgi:hypothetical protein
VSASDSGGGDLVALPSALLAPLRELAALYQRYGSVPRAIFALISLYILNGLFSIINVVAGSVLFVFDLIVGSLRTAQALLVGAFGAVGVDILGALLGVQQAVSGVVVAAGPLGPPLAVAAASLMLYVLYRLAVALLGELPGGSTLVDLLGLR